MGLLEIEERIDTAPTPQAEHGGEFFFWRIVAVPGVKTAIVGSLACGALLAVGPSRPPVTDLDILNTQNPGGAGSCEALGGTMQNLGSLSLRAGGVIYNHDNVDSRKAGYIPPNTTYAWEVCMVTKPNVTEPAGSVMYGMDSDVLGAMIGQKLADNDGQAWIVDQTVRQTTP